MGFIQRIIGERKAKFREYQTVTPAKVEKYDKAKLEKEISDYKAGQKSQAKERAIIKRAKEGMIAERKEIRARRIGKAKKVIKRIGSGLKKAKARGSKLRSSLGGTSGSRDVFGSGSRDVFGGGRNVFYDEPKKKEKGKTVVIKIQ